MADQLTLFRSVEEKLRGRFGDELLGTTEFRGELSVDVKSKDITQILRFCTTEPDLKLEYLNDLTAVDYLHIETPERYAVVYHLQNPDAGDVVRVRSFIPETNPKTKSVSAIWKSAVWLEREVFDLFGIKFEGHPSLKRILMPDDYTGHPLRKDYPLKGRGERDSFKIVKRDKP